MNLAAFFFMISVFPLHAQIFPITVNCGSADDQFFVVAGAPATAAYSNPNMPADLSTLRVGNSVRYRIPVPSGAYIVFLTFVEPTKTSTGQRIMNVTINNRETSQNFDIFALGGAKQDVAVRRAYLGVVETDVMDILVTGVVGTAVISRIEISGVAVPDPSSFVNPK